MKSSRPLRLVFALLAFAANLVVVGAPLLHAVAHDAHEEVGLVVAAAERVDHDHAEVHPPSLHDEAVLLRGAVLDFAFVTPAPVAGLDLRPTSERTVISPPALGWVSRAPPPGDLARAPPLV